MSNNRRTSARVAQNRSVDTRRSTSKVVVTKQVKTRSGKGSPIYVYQADDFERKPKTDYTYSRSGTYVTDYDDGDSSLPIPNMSRRHIHDLEGVYGSEYELEIARRTRRYNLENSELSEATSLTDGVSGYGLSTSTPLNTNNNRMAPATRRGRREEYTSQSMMDNTIEEEFRRKEMPRRATSKSRVAATRAQSSTRRGRSSKKDEVGLEFGLDSDYSDTDFTSETTMTASVSTVRSVSRRSTLYQRLLQFFTGGYNRVSYSVLTVTSIMYRFLGSAVLLDAAALSRLVGREEGGRRKRKGCCGVLPLLLLFLPFGLFLLCGAHSWGFVNAPVCSYLGGIYYMTQESIASSPLFSPSAKEVLLDLGAKSDQAAAGANSVQLEALVASLVDRRLAEAMSSKEQENNKQVSLQLQKLSTLDSATEDLRQDLLRLREKQDLAALREQKLPSEEYLLTVLRHEINKLNETLTAAQAASIPPPPPTAPTYCSGSDVLCASELEIKLLSLRADLARLAQKHEEVVAAAAGSATSNGGSTSVYISSPNGTGISEEHVKALIHKQLSTYSADKTGMPDFALESVGGQVVTTRCSDTYYGRSSMLTWFDIPLWHVANSPRIVIQAEISPGQCWAFYGSRGSVVIKLAGLVRFTSFSLEHIPKVLSPTGNLDTAPKDIEIYGLVDEYDHSTQLIRSGQYDANGEPLQFFPVQGDSTSTFSVVELRVLSNWGNPDYTCLYRFRVHGKLINS